MRRGLTTLAVIALTLSVVVNPGVLPSGSQPPTAAQSTVQETTSVAGDQLYQGSVVSVCRVGKEPICTKCSPGQICPARDLLDTIAAFFGPANSEKGETNLVNESYQRPAKTPKRASITEKSQELPESHWGVPIEVRPLLRFVLATVPDPAHTHLGLFFDRQIEAIQQAAQDDGYNFARASMPWEAKNHSEPPDLKGHLLWREYRRGQEEMPGLMIFRKTKPDALTDAQAPLFVFVVGETPTGGINKRQFANAIRAIREIREGSGVSTKPLYMLGPTFAGSLYSLMFLLKQLPAGLFPVSIIHSGTASGSETIEWFRSFKIPERPSFTFRTFQEGDCYALAQLVGFLKGEGYPARDVAVLSEDESAYGAEPCGDASEVLQLHFPREISALRSAYQHDTQESQGSKNAEKWQARTTLRPNLEDTGSDDDSVPSYSPAQTALSEEAVLMGILSNLQAHHTQFVLIRATNPLDALFLGRYLRTGYPEGRIITIGADLRFQRELDDPRLRGILSLTSYPLLPGSDDHTALPSGVQEQLHTHRVFPSSLSVGTFNALLSLLKCDPSDPQSAALVAKSGSFTGGTGNKELSCNDLPIARYTSYGWPVLAKRAFPDSNDSKSLVAPLWLTALGRNGYWPVALLNGSAKKHSSPSSELKNIPATPQWPRNRMHSPVPWRTVFWLGIAVAVGFLYLMWTGSLIDASDTSANFAPFKVPARNLVFFVTDLLLLIMLLALSWPWVLWGSRFMPARWVFWIGLATVAVIVAGFKDLRRRGATKLPWWFLGISVVACVVSCVLARLGSPLAQNFMMYRLVHITSGLSPLLPLLLLLAAGLWWAWYTLGGLALLDGRRPRLPRMEDLKLKKNDLNDHSRTQVGLNQLSREQNRNVTRLMKPNSWDVRLYAPPAVFLLLTGTAVDTWHPVKSLEGQGYDVVYGWLLGLIIFILILGLARLAVVWLELRGLLIYLDQFPLRRSFERLEGFTWKPIWRLGTGAAQDSYRLIWRQFDSLEHLWNEGIGDLDLKEAVEKARAERNRFAAELEEMHMQDEQQKESKSKGKKIVSSIRMLFKPQPGWVKKWIEDLEELQKQLATTCGAALKYLSGVWGSEKDVDMFEVSRREKDRQPAKKPKEGRTTQLAEQFVCLFYLNFILSVIFRMRTLVMSAAGIYVFALFSFSSYPFEPRSSFHVLMIVLFLLVIGVVAIVLAQMHRNGTLSRITNTVPGELGVDFWLRLATFVAVPLLSLLAAQFPEISGALFSWVEPLQALK